MPFRSCGAWRPRSRRPRHCERASTRNGARAACARHASLWLARLPPPVLRRLPSGWRVFGSSTSGQSFQAALAATDLAPGASGEATLTKTSAGWRIQLDATGLPRLDGGRFYEAWLRNPAGVLVPVGTFNQGPKVTLWAGVPPTDFTTLTVTRERADGNQASSGEKVLVGPVQTGG